MVTMDYALTAAQQIWEDLSDRRGFGLDCLRYDDAELWEEIQEHHANIIRKAVEAKGGTP